MVQDQVCYSSSSSGCDPQARKDSFKVLDMITYPQAKMITLTQSKSEGVKKSKKTDIWGPVFQNKQHFVDMHLC
ncbi:hypothetical protein Hamer_G023688 [Homarus americanus]|uniref:Uncharacterized protein n=1 Tax=Homarus americanus TaxID=6706 RepID=A0A8J5JB41_HOMAM|nr:hypothetical protein Hamer_G023688 [Homarus americanus]